MPRAQAQQEVFKFHILQADAARFPIVTLRFMHYCCDNTFEVVRLIDGGFVMKTSSTEDAQWIEDVITKIGFPATKRRAIARETSSA